MDEIRLVDETEYPRCIEIIRAAFSTVAEDFHLTRENAPTNPAFIELRHLHKMRDKGIRMYGLFEDGVPIGFVALEKLEEPDYCMERLAVLPERRHRGYGRTLVRFISDTVGKEGGKRLKIGVINENTVLKDWYAGLGFCETGTKTFDYLPFTVCYMEHLV